MSDVQSAARLLELAEKATKAPWEYRPELHDDWGWIRDATGTVAVHSRAPYCNEATLDEHRRAKTDPWQANAEFIAYARNHAEDLATAVIRMEKALREGADCLEDIANGRGGWAWEEVLQSMREALPPSPPPAQTGETK